MKILGLLTLLEQMIPSLVLVWLKLIKFQLCSILKFGNTVTWCLIWLSVFLCVCSDDPHGIHSLFAKTLCNDVSILCCMHTLSMFPFYTSSIFTLYLFIFTAWVFCLWVIAVCHGLLRQAWSSISNLMLWWLYRLLMDSNLFQMAVFLIW